MFYVICDSCLLSEGRLQALVNHLRKLDRPNPGNQRWHSQSVLGNSDSVLLPFVYITMNCDTTCTHCEMPHCNSDIWHQSCAICFSSTVCILTFSTNLLNQTLNRFLLLNFLTDKEKEFIFGTLICCFVITDFDLHRSYATFLFWMDYPYLSWFLPLQTFKIW